MHGRGWRDENNRDYVAFCIADAETASAFSDEFVAASQQKRRR
jgi:hypothetical protein